MRWDYYGVIGEEATASACSTRPAAGHAGDAALRQGLEQLLAARQRRWDVTGDGKRVVRAGYGLYYDAFSQDFFVGQLPWNTFNPGPAYNDILFSFSPVAELVAGAPVFDESSFSASDVFTVDRMLRTPYVQIYNVNYQHEIGARAAVQVGYVGSLGPAISSAIATSTSSIRRPAPRRSRTSSTSTSSSRRRARATTRCRRACGSASGGG